MSVSCAVARGASLLLRFLAAALATFAAAAPAAAVEPIFVRLPSPHREDPARVVKLVVGNPLVADVTVEPGGVAVITAKGHGTTNIVALGNAGIVLMERPIEVQEPAARGWWSFAVDAADL
jgi:Flp pilus assembly secretin CpaC